MHNKDAYINNNTVESTVCIYYVLDIPDIPQSLFFLW